MLSTRLATKPLDVLSGVGRLDCRASMMHGPMRIGAGIVVANRALAEDPHVHVGDLIRSATSDALTCTEHAVDSGSR